MNTYWLELRPFNNSAVRILFDFPHPPMERGKIYAVDDFPPRILEIEGASLDDMDLDAHFFKAPGQGFLKSYREVLQEQLVTIVKVNFGGVSQLERDYGRGKEIWL